MVTVDTEYLELNKHKWWTPDFFVQGLRAHPQIGDPLPFFSLEKSHSDEFHGRFILNENVFLAYNSGIYSFDFNGMGEMATNTTVEVFINDSPTGYGASVQQFSNPLFHFNGLFYNLVQFSAGIILKARDRLSIVLKSGHLLLSPSSPQFSGQLIE